MTMLEDHQTLPTSPTLSPEGIRGPGVITNALIRSDDSVATPKPEIPNQIHILLYIVNEKPS